MKRINSLTFWLLACLSIILAASRLEAAQAARVDVILWFDTEDYLLPASDDAAKRLAELLSKRDILATFKVVGEKARVLERRGRADVIAALRKHDIGYHTNFHSVHPAPAEYLADCGLLDGVAEFVRREKQGAADVRRVFGRETLACYGQPGSSWACQAIIALKEIGVSPVYVDDGSHVGLRGKPFWYAGALNCYDMGPNVTRMELHEAKALEEGNSKVTQIVQRLADEGGGLISIYYHPCEFVHRQFWDGVNFSRGANPPREEWKAPPQLTAEKTEQAFGRFEKYIDHIKSLGVRFVTASELPAIYADRVSSEGLTEAELLGLARRLTDPKATGVDYQVLEGKTISPADQFELFARAMGDLIDGKVVKYPLAAKGLLGPDSAPGSAGEGGQMIAWPAFRDAAVDVRDYLRAHGRVPARVFIGADSVTPADFLGALAFAYQFERQHGKLPLEGVRLGKGLAVLTERHVAKDPAGLFDWDIHKSGFRPAKILEVARLQAWTLKPAVRSTQQAAAEDVVRRAFVIVTGRVQGVGFRAFAQEQARNLGLTGYVLNRADGSVEATIEGPTDKVKRLLELMKRGPETARVDGLRVTNQSPKGEFKAFEIGYEASRGWPE
ncbi:MAG: acylphosphatase [Planctomycetota bacterium]|nr:acylphosphatase [Planctomycetota bacterium]